MPKKWKGKAIPKPKPSARSVALAEEKERLDEQHRQRKLDFLQREKQRKATS